MQAVATLEAQAASPHPAVVTTPCLHGRIDTLEAAMLAIGPCEPPVPVIRITPNLYSREVTLKAGQLLTTRIHKQHHQYIVSRGIVLVLVGGVWEIIEGHHHGETLAGTRRVIFVIEETVWTTFHPTLGTNPAEIEAELAEPFGASGADTAVTEEDVAALQTALVRMRETLSLRMGGAS